MSHHPKIILCLTTLLSESPKTRYITIKKIIHAKNPTPYKPFYKRISDTAAMVTKSFKKAENKVLLEVLPNFELTFLSLFRVLEMHHQLAQKLQDFHAHLPHVVSTGKS